MEISLSGIQDCPSDAVLSIRAGGLRRQAPVRLHQKFYFPAGVAEGDCRIDVLKKMASTTMKLQDLRGSSTTNVTLSTGDGPMNIEMAVSKVGGGQFEALEKADDADAPVKSRHLAAVRTKEYLDEHSLQETIETMVKEVLLQKPKQPMKFMVDYMLQKVSGEEGDAQMQLPKVLDECAHWRAQYHEMVKIATDKDNEMATLASTTFDLERQITDLRKTEFQLMASNEMGVKLVSENQRLLGDIERLESELMLTKGSSMQIAAEIRMEENLDAVFSDVLFIDKILDKLPGWLQSLITGKDWADHCDGIFDGVDNDGNGVLTPDELFPVIVELVGEHPLAITL
jgi:hypothetical protein